MTKFNDMQVVKRRFFAMRNGAVADNMRKLGANYRIIFGLNLPQIVEIANETPKDAVLAEALWNNKSTRESQLMAPMIYPREQFGFDVACRWATEVTTIEVSDVLCHRLLRHMDYAWQLAEVLIKSSITMERYVALRLMFNLLPSNLEKIEQYAEDEKAKEESLTMLLCHQLLNEIAFIREDLE